MLQKVTSKPKKVTKSVTSGEMPQSDAKKVGEITQSADLQKVKPGDVARLPNGKFAPGHSGIIGSGHRPGQLTLTEVVRMYQAKPIDEVREIYRDGKITALVATACRIVLDAAERTGSVEVLKEKWNRLEGKVPDRLQVQSERVTFNIVIPGEDDPIEGNAHDSAVTVSQ